MCFSSPGTVVVGSAPYVAAPLGSKTDTPSAGASNPVATPCTLPCGHRPSTTLSLSTALLVGDLSTAISLTFPLPLR